MFLLSRLFCDDFDNTNVIFQYKKCNIVTPLIEMINKKNKICNFCADNDDLVLLNKEDIIFKQLSTNMTIIGGIREDGCILNQVKIYKYDLNNNGLKEIFISQHNPYLSLPHLNLITEKKNKYFSIIDGGSFKGSANFKILKESNYGFYNLLMYLGEKKYILKFNGKVYELK